MGDNLRKERVQLGLSIEEVAAGMGVAPAALRSWETGEDEPSGSDLLRMSRYYGCSPDWLLGMACERTTGLVSA